MVRHAKSKALSNEDVWKLISNTKTTLNKFILTCMILGGMRVNEVLHMKRSWVHINDTKSKEDKINHIQIPNEDDFCKCEECQLQSYFELKRGKGGHKTSDWYREISKEFYDLKHKSLLPKKLGRNWKPKSSAGERLIPIHFKTFEEAITGFFDKYKNLVCLNRLKIKKHKKRIKGKPIEETKIFITRRDVWYTIRKLSKKILGKDKIIYPHVCRATVASLWANRASIDVNDLKVLMGWKSIKMADFYVKSDQKRMISNTKKVYKLLGKSGKQEL